LLICSKNEMQNNGFIVVYWLVHCAWATFVFWPLRKHLWKSVELGALFYLWMWGAVILTGVILTVAIVR
jgi:hypothetical protein